jgi:hypothetical protein
MRFLEKVTDMVGVYLNPPERAIAFSTDESLDGSQSAQTEFGSLDRIRRRERGIEFRAFLQIVDRETPATLDVHLLLDHRLAPAPPELDRWLRQHPRIHLHYLPSDRSGVTLIDRLVADFSRRGPRVGESANALRLRHALKDHVRSARGTPTPFVWTSTAEEVRLA